MNEEMSLEEKMHEAYSLSLNLAYETISPNGTFFGTRNFNFGKEHDDMISVWCDGLMHKYYQDIQSGRCSLSAAINFDVEKFERKVEDAIHIFSALISIVGFPRKLTKNDMRQMGYRGEWAGYTKDEDLAYYHELDKQHLAKAEQELKEHKKLPAKKQNWDLIFHLERDIRYYQTQISEYNRKISA